jgi:hypothetical protein
MTNSVMPTLRMVRTALTRVLSFVPMTSSTVKTATIATGPQSRSTGPIAIVVGTSRPKRPKASER